MLVQPQLRTIVHHLLWIEIVEVTRVRYHRYGAGIEDGTIAIFRCKGDWSLSAFGQAWHFLFFPLLAPRHYRHSFCREGFPVCWSIGSADYPQCVLLVGLAYAGCSSPSQSSCTVRWGTRLSASLFGDADLYGCHCYFVLLSLPSRGRCEPGN